ncbi:MAG: hypothetical protein LBS00_08010 [Synergistaceae bacterium]|jgi:hypothetical protein|nr:hypothetical protein [Synergistaceae bacterium]
MKIFDKAQWHIDGGEIPEDVIEKFRTVFQFLWDQNLLTDEGIEIFQFGADSSTSLHERLVNEEGREFLSKHYDDVINLTASAIASKLSELYAVFLLQKLSLLLQKLSLLLQK